MEPIELPYGKNKQAVDLRGYQVDIFLPHETLPAPDGLAEVNRALSNPEDGVSLERFAGRAHTAAIAVNDKTRPVPHLQQLLPLINRLNSIGIPDQKILIIIAVGTHKPAGRAEIMSTLPAEVTGRVRVVSHDCDDIENLVSLGTTTRGTPVTINKRFYQADLRIVTGNIEPHHFMGFSGGVKTACIGLGGRTTITTNHRMLADPRAVIGSLEENPMRQDLEEMGRLAKIDYALNTVLTDDRQIIRAFAGSPQAVLAAGVRLSREICGVKIDRPYDLVITSPGGYPKDINLYQAQKAVSHAAAFTRPGGAIILAAECVDGSGSLPFEQFMQDVSTPQQALEKFEQTGFEIGPHKAFQIGRQASQFDLYMVSAMPDEKVRRLMFTPAASVQEALKLAANAQPAIQRVAVLPYATHLIVDRSRIG